MYTINKRLVNIREDLAKCHPNWIQSPTTPQRCQGSCTRFRISPTVTCLWMHILGINTERNGTEQIRQIDLSASSLRARKTNLQKNSSSKNTLDWIALLYTDMICIRAGIWNKSLQWHHGLPSISISLSLSVSPVSWIHTYLCYRLLAHLQEGNDGTSDRRTISNL